MWLDLYGGRKGIACLYGGDPSGEGGMIIVKHTPTCCSFLPAGTACRTLISHIMQSGGTVPLLEPIPVAWDIRTRYMRV